MIEKLFKVQTWKFLLIAYVVALISRVMLVFFYGQISSIENYEPLIIGKNISEGYGFAMHWPYIPFDEHRWEIKKNTIAPSFGTTFIPPVVPYLYSGYVSLMGISDNSLRLLMVIQAIVGALLPLITYGATKQFFGSSTARWASITCLGYLPVAMTAVTFSGAVLYPIVALGIMWCLGILYWKKSLKAFALLGLLSGILSLMRSEFYYIFFILTFITILVWYKKYALKEKLILAIVSVILFATATGWWALRNYNEFGRFIPVTGHPWREMWRGYNPYSTGSGSGANGFNLWENKNEYAHITRSLDSIPFNNKFEEKADKVYKEEVVSFVKLNPLQSMWLAVKKVIMFWTIDVHYEKAKHPLYIIPQLFVFALSVLGAWYLYKENKKLLLPWVVLFICYSGVFALTYVLPRYQSYVFPMFFPLCGLALCKLFDRKRQSI